jgi:hypothetical protein
MRRTVAFFDVLGFRNLLAKEGTQRLGERYIQVSANLDALLKPFLTDPSLPMLFPDQGQEPWCITHVFSDSLIFISHGESESDCRKLLVYALRAMQVLLASKLPVRGGLAFDELFINQQRQLFLGPALTKAYELEQSQDWVGAALHPSIETAFPRLIAETSGGFGEKLFPPYAVPMKTGTIRQYRTLNWRWNLVVQQGTRSLFDMPDTWPERRKVENALAYARHIRTSGLAYPATAADAPLEIRDFFVGEGPPRTLAHGDDI